MQKVQINSTSDILKLLDNNNNGDLKCEDLAKRCTDLLKQIDYIPTTDEVDDTRYMVMSNGQKRDEKECEEQSEYIEVNAEELMKDKDNKKHFEGHFLPNFDPSDCPYIGLPLAHLKLNPNVLKYDENIKLFNKRSSVTLGLLSGRWLLIYNAKTTIKPSKCLFIYNLQSPKTKNEKLFEVATVEGHFGFLVKNEAIKNEWITAISKELSNQEEYHLLDLPETLYDEPNNLNDDLNLEKILRFNYDIPKMPPKPVVQATTSNRLEFQLKYQVIKEQLSSQLRQPKLPSESPNSSQSSSTNPSPARKFSKLRNLFRMSNSPAEIVEESVKAKPKRKTDLDLDDSSVYEIIDNRK